jgi:hypothetical protein
MRKPQPQPISTGGVSSIPVDYETMITPTGTMLPGVTIGGGIGISGPSTSTSSGSRERVVRATISSDSPPPIDAPLTSVHSPTRYHGGGNGGGNGGNGGGGTMLSTTPPPLGVIVGGGGVGGGGGRGMVSTPPFAMWDEMAEDQLVNLLIHSRSLLEQQSIYCMPIYLHHVQSNAC